MAEHWAKAPMPRDQIALFSPTLDDVIGEDHPVRLFDEILRTLDWSAWIAPWGEHSGRPKATGPITARFRDSARNPGRR